ncbi:MAG: hypothetical protein AAGH65_11490 [Pseudomonadota bacterium]
MNRLSWISLWLAASMHCSAEASEIYRCADGDTTVFSDQPCGDDAQLHQSEQRISVVDAADNFDQIIEQNEAYLEQRRNDRQQQREQAAERAREQTRFTTVVEYVPLYYPVRPRPYAGFPDQPIRPERPRPQAPSEALSSRDQILSLSRSSPPNNRP